ncbi:class I SAM-dependent methyltransferase [Paractinoplanes globisporus]|uniref:Class I SAM-dependent methyltransferase n=1 Tax=Paractinoplanes globisporus TaxID=113565 RepID=A0ABW6WEP7_9ACTN|nr:class I SAM-dependent methyltransferase [Actinoplanes globisporus]
MQAAHLFANAERYDRHAGRLGAKLYAKVVADAAAAGLPDGARVLDAGTGPGRIPRDLAARRPSWIIDAVDLEPKMIEYARQQDPDGRVTFTVGDVAALPYADATFDLIVSSISQHHWGDVEGGVRDLRRVLRPGGRLWIYDARWALRRALRAAGKTFDSVRKEPVSIGHLPIPLIARLTARA